MPAPSHLGDTSSIGQLIGMLRREMEMGSIYHSLGGLTVSGPRRTIVLLSRLIYVDSDS